MQQDQSTSNKSLVVLQREFNQMPQNVIITGDGLKFNEVIAVSRYNSSVEFTKDAVVLNRIKLCYEKMMEDVASGIPVYGCNTGYGAQASRVLVNGSSLQRLSMAKRISEGIAHVDVSVGPLFSKDIIRAAILIRINMLMKGVSAIRLKDLDIYRQMLNKQITPLVNQYGGLGASGDLAHNGRIVSAARGLKGVKVWDKKDKIREAKEVLDEMGISLLKLEPKAGLGLVNGDNFSTALALLLTNDTLEMLLISTLLGALTIEVLGGTNRTFHSLISKVRPHPGQIEVAKLYRYLLDGSKLALQEMTGQGKRSPGTKVQDSYSLRAIQQYSGVSFEKIRQIIEVIQINMNSASDNPLWVPPDYTNQDEAPWSWVSGANFFAMHMADALDSLRKVMTHIIKLNDRHLAKIVNPHDNNGLPSNLSDKNALSGCVFKGVQIQSGMFDVYSSLLSIPVNTFFGTHEENNQDITSHAITSAILGIENLRLVRYSTAQNLLALAQAVDFLGGPKKLSPRTQPIYEFVRHRTSYVEKETPLNNEIETIYKSIINGELMKIVRDRVLNDFDK